MDHKKTIQLVIAWTFAFVFVVTAIFTTLSLIGMVSFADPEQQKTLFYVLIVEIVIAGVTYVIKVFLESKKSGSVPTPPKKLHDIMKSASKNLIISGHTLDKFSHKEGGDVRSALESLFKRKVDVTLILLHPYCAYQEAHERFHLHESEGSFTSSRVQIENTIRYFKNMEDIFEDNFSVFLSEYMPRFRTILVDEKICYINLYMFGKDVGETPSHVYHKDSQEFKSIDKSVAELLQSPYVTPLIKNGKFQPDWSGSGISHVLETCVKEGRCLVDCRRWRHFRSILMGDQSGNHQQDSVPGVCGSDYIAGTFTLADMGLSQRFLGMNLTYNHWLNSAVDDTLNVLRGNEYCRTAIDNYNRAALAFSLKNALEFAPHGGKPIRDETYYQEYSDVVRRIMLAYLVGNPDLDVEQQPDLTSGAKGLTLATIGLLKSMKISLEDWLKLTVIAGAIGISAKPDHAATSRIIREAGIPLEKPEDSGKSDDEKAHGLADRLRDELERETGVDDTALFFAKLNENHLHPQRVHIASIPDDYIETLFLMQFYDELLANEGSVHITIIPRSIRCGNDAITGDIIEVLPYFPNLQLLNAGVDQRFTIATCGPKIGGVHLRKIHPDMVKIIRKADFLDVRGARNFEMMQGVLKDSFFGFMVARTTSEIVTGLEARKTPFFYKFQKAGTRSFPISDTDKIPSIK